MLLITTMSYNELGEFIRNKSVSLNNDSLIFGQDAGVLQQYMAERFGTPGYVVGIRGCINEASAKLLSQLDKGLAGNKLIIEAPVDESETICFTVKGIAEAADILAYGLPDEILYDHLDNSIVSSDSTESGIKIVCVPDIKKVGDIKITTLNREISVDTGDITFIKLKGIHTSVAPK